MAENRKQSDGRSASDEARRLAELVLHAATLETDARAQYLQDATGEDPALLEEAHRRLLAALQLESSFLAEPAGRLFAKETPDAWDREGGPRTMREPERFPPGTVLGERYRIVSFLGRGGMGEVYRADDGKLGEPVALKFLPPALAHDAARRARLLGEARIARKITHQNVCRVHDVGEAEGLHYLSMEYIDGEDLASLIRRIGRLPMAKAREIGLEICSGLAAAHRLGILHRDLKPSNLMLDSAGRTRITDFGLAGVEGTSEHMGSPAYLAPERWDGADATVRSEIYALGSVLYELFTGYPAFRRASVTELPRLHRESLPVPPSRRLEGFDPSLERLILHCLEKDPARRPASVEEVAEALEGAASSDVSWPGGEPRAGARLQALLLCDLGGSHAFAEELDHGAFLARRRGMVHDLLRRHHGQEIETAGSWLALFERPIHAVAFALDYHANLGVLSRESGHALQGRVAIHVDEVLAREDTAGGTARDTGLLEEEGPAQSTVRRLLSLVAAGQTLLTRNAFDLARRGVVGEENREDLCWLAHGAYLFAAVDEPVEVFEVGVKGRSPLAAPEDSAKAWRVMDGQTVLGWRPAPGVKIPGRPHWTVSEKIGESDFGDVWRVTHGKTGERRVFKFCYEARSLRSLKREITLFRLLKHELGERPDITRILDCNFEEAPYYIESEYTAGGNLLEWAEKQGGIRRIPLTQRLEILAQVAEALAAAHTVGVLHKDIQPLNVLITESRDGPRARLTDFGRGVLLDRKRLDDADFTVQGMSEGSGRLPVWRPSATDGPRLYLAPELMEGRVATVQADVYSLGVFLYQLAVGDLSRALAPGWQREVKDELLRQDIAEAVDGAPGRRLRDAQLLADRLRTLDERRAALETERRRTREAERARRRWRLLAVAAAILVLFTGAAVFHAQRTAREAQRAAREAEAARLVSQFMVDLFEVSFPSEARGNTVTAREILDRGAEKILLGLGERPLARARLMDTIGTVYVKLGLYDQASPLLEEALETRRRLLGEDHADVATSSAELAAALSRFDEAESFYQRTLEIQRDALGPDHPAVIQTLDGLGATYLRRGRYAEAQATYEEALKITEEALGPKHPDIVAPLDNLARNLREQGRFDEAEPLFWRALAIGEEVLGPDHPQVATILTNLGDLFRFQGKYAEAETYYRRSLDLKERVFGRDHPEVATTLGTYAQVFEHQGRYDEAEAFFLRAQAISAKASDPRIGYSWSNLGDLYRKQGRYAEAEELLQQSLGLAETYLPPDHRLLAYPLLGLANIYRDQKRYAEAEPLYERAIGIREKVLPPGHLRLVEAYGDYAEFLRATSREAVADEFERRLDSSPPYRD